MWMCQLAGAATPPCDNAQPLGQLAFVDLQSGCFLSKQGQRHAGLLAVLRRSQAAKVECQLPSVVYRSPEPSVCVPPPPPQIDEGRLGVKDAPDTERRDIIVRPGHGRKADGIWRELLTDAVCALPAVPSTLVWRVHTSVMPALAAGVSPSSAWSPACASSRHFCPLPSFLRKNDGRGGVRGRGWQGAASHPPPNLPPGGGRDELGKEGEGGGWVKWPRRVRGWGEGIGVGDWGVGGRWWRGVASHPPPSLPPSRGEG